MKNNNGRRKKFLIILSILVLNCLGFINSVYATSINTAHLYTIGDCGQLLKYRGTVVKVSYVQYDNEGNCYPAYCLDKTKPGVETQSYSVSVENAITDVGLWKTIVNGFPYKSIQELGVANKEEAFTATKQAIYCYIHGNNPSDYQGIGEAGQRTLNAMHAIINSAQNSHENKVSNNIKINKGLSDWKQDNIDKNYLSKIYSVSAGSNIQKYFIKINRSNAQDIGGMKITNLENVEKTEFSPDENFKVLIPIKNMTQINKFELYVTSKVFTKPVLYGKAPNSSYQDYALTADTYEEGNGSLSDESPKNETRIIILKKDEDSGKKLENVEFQLLDENKSIAYSGLKTDKEGRIVIENIVPGKYYLQETNTIDGYKKYDELIEINLSLNNQYTVTVNNKAEEKPKIEISKQEKSKEVKNREIKKLPVTGM